MRRLLALVSSIIFVDAMLYTALTPLVPDYADEFDLSKTGAGLLLAAFGAGALLGGIPGGLAAARFSPKHAVVGGLVLLGIASFAFALADGAVTLGLARFVQGFSSTVTWAGALAWVCERGAEGAAGRDARDRVRRRRRRRDPRARCSAASPRRSASGASFDDARRRRVRFAGLALLGRSAPVRAARADGPPARVRGPSASSAASG